MVLAANAQAGNRRVLAEYRSGGAQAPRAGLEPATRGLEGRRSFQLSYRGECCESVGQRPPPPPIDDPLKKKNQISKAVAAISTVTTTIFSAPEMRAALPP
jgi:hypothetical protein